MSSSEAILPVGVGYDLTVGISFLFALIMLGSQSLKSGLVASSVVSTWTWAATLLQSTTVTYRYGISGALRYAGGACVQIILFATLAIELRRRPPNAHTFLEVVKVRYEPVTPGVFIVPPFKPQRYDWASMATINKGDESDIVASSATLDFEHIPSNGAALQPTVS